MNTHNRRSIRLKGYDYAQKGAYFVTICVNDRRNLFGGITDGKMELNDMGKIVKDAWRWLGNQYEYIELDEFIIMPNHMHGIICINDVGRGGSDEFIIMPNHMHGIICINDVGRGGSRTAPTMKIKPLGRLIGAFKTVSTKQINIIRQMPGRQFWQRNYYEHIIRDDNDLTRIREYLINNPAQWEQDDHYVK